jgi:hypothetical protein
MANTANNKVNKSALQEAKIDFEEIRNFAKDAAVKEIQGQLEEHLEKIMNQAINNETVNEEVKIDANGVNITIGDGGEVTVDKSTEAAGSTMETPPMTSEPTEPSSSEDEFEVVPDEEEFEVGDEDTDNTDNKEHMENITNEDAAGTPAMDAGAEAPVTDASATGTEVVSNPFQEIMDKLSAIEAQIGGGAPTPTAGGAPTGGDIEITDDGSGAPTGAPAPAPVSEEEEFEIIDMDHEHGHKHGMEDEAVYEIVEDMQDENIDEIEVTDENTPAMEESGYGTSFSSERQINRRQAYTRDSKDKHHNPQAPRSQASLSESEVWKMVENKFKAQYESKLDELIQENVSLTGSLKESQKELADFRKSFIELRGQINEWQTFNAKLVYANKVLASGGFTVAEKTQFAEQFDKAKSAKDAEELYKKIIKEFKLDANKQTITDKLKSPATNVVKSVSQPLYESVEMKRMKELAFGKKSE